MVVQDKMVPVPPLCDIVDALCVPNSTVVGHHIPIPPHSSLPGDVNYTLVCQYGERFCAVVRCPLPPCHVPGVSGILPPFNNSYLPIDLTQASNFTCYPMCDVATSFCDNITGTVR
jgi:hypothetical protein